MAWRDLEEQVIHDRVVAALRKTLFNYPNEKHPGSKTLTNHPIKTHAIRDIVGEQFYPDLVVLDVSTEKVISVIEVETINSISENEMPQWIKFASLSENFYLFFPRGYASKVKELCLKISNVLLYEYWEDSGHYRAEHIKI